MRRERIAAVAELPDDGTFLFRVEPIEGDVDVEREAILIRTDGDAGGAEDGGGVESGAGDDSVVAWLNYCQHFTHIKLDKGGGAPLRNGEVVCANHGAMFEIDTGRCTHGPCEGAFLNGLEVRVDGGDVYLDDPDYDFVGLGPVEDEGGDLSSTSNVEF